MIKSNLIKYSYNKNIVFIFTFFSITHIALPYASDDTKLDQVPSSPIVNSDRFWVASFDELEGFKMQSETTKQTVGNKDSQKIIDDSQKIFWRRTKTRKTTTISV
jgi:hypothetical protein